jgi:hypothetical protein
MRGSERGRMQRALRARMSRALRAGMQRRDGGRGTRGVESCCAQVMEGESGCAGIGAQGERTGDRS